MARKSKELPQRSKSCISTIKGFNGKGERSKLRQQYRLLVEGVCERKYTKSFISTKISNWPSIEPKG